MKGLDIAFAGPPPAWWQSRYVEGYRIAVQNLWTGGFAGNDGIRAVAERNILNARFAGFLVAAYANASPPDWWPLDVQMNNIKANARGQWPYIDLVCVDVEIPGITMARVMELADALEAEGKRADVLYTGRWFWTGHMGNSTDPRWLRFKLWSSHYDWNPDIDFASAPYGPWQGVIGEQYAGTVTVDGYAVDLNTFMGGFILQEDDMGMTPEERAELDALKAFVAAHAVLVRDISTSAAFLLQGKQHRYIPSEVWPAMRLPEAAIVQVPHDAIIARAPERGPDLTLEEAEEWEPVGSDVPHSHTFTGKTD